MLFPNDHQLVEETPEHQAFTDLVRLTIRKRELAAETRAVEARLRLLEPQVLSYFGEGGYQKIKIEGYTLSPHREPWIYPAAHATDEQVIEALKECGLAHYVKEVYSTKSLTTYVRQLEENAGSIENTLSMLPPELAKVVRIEPTYRVQVLKTWR
jgi:hypothetical protein